VFARAVTEVLAPAVLVAVVSPLVAWHSGSLGWGLAVAVFAAGVPFAFILGGVRRGAYDNHHVGDWRRRPVILLVAGGSVLVLLGLMLAFAAPRELVALVVAMLAGLVLTLGVTVLARWKVSLLAAVAAGTATTLGLVFGRWLLLTWLAVALVAWARVRMRDHTVAQVLVGVALGALAAGTVFPALR
jgi:hypothetical protein